MDSFDEFLNGQRERVAAYESPAAKRRRGKARRLRQQARRNSGDVSSEGEMVAANHNRVYDNMDVETRGGCGTHAMGPRTW